MNDAAFDLLKSELDTASGNALWIADENALRPAQLTAANQTVAVISNRFDLCQRLKSNGWNCSFSDFDLSVYPDQSVDRIYYRISKEKPVVHHIINEALRCLKVDGEFYITGLKNEGIKTYLTKAKGLFDGQIELSKSDKNTWMGLLKRPTAAGSEPLDDQDYGQLREVASDERFSYISKPGVYGWNKIDKGSEYLISELDQFIAEMTKPPERILDLGCGYGYLSLNCQQLNAEITATDNNAAAIAICKENFSRNKINGKVIAADCAADIEQKFPMIICNPPFHQGFSIDGDLTEHFLQATRRKLEPTGVACFVVNLHIPLERKAKKLFATVRTVADNGSFRLVMLARPK